MRRLADDLYILRVLSPDASNVHLTGDVLVDFGHGAPLRDPGELRAFASRLRRDRCSIPGGQLG
jgi:hypothetical protein